MGALHGSWQLNYNPTNGRAFVKFAKERGNAGESLRGSYGGALGSDHAPVIA
jgi:hypothetical protein